MKMHRRRPAPHRHRRDRRPAPADPARHRRDAVPRHAAPHAVGRLDRHGLHRRAHQRLRGAARPRCATARRDPVAQACGITKEDLVQAARWFGARRTPTLVSLYCQGLNQCASGTAKNAALINLHLATGQIGKPGAGPFSLTGQPNAMGGREVGGLANLLSAHRDLANAAAPRRSGRAVGRARRARRSPARRAVEMFQAAADGEIKALWIACTNPAQSMPDQATVRRALRARRVRRACRRPSPPPPPAHYADLLLPATTWGEKDGTRHQQRAPHQPRARRRCPRRARRAHDWRIAVDFARRLEARLRTAAQRRLGELFPITTAPEAVWNEHRESTRGRDLDITGLSYAMLEPRPAAMAVARRRHRAAAQRLYEDGVFPTADGRARFADAPTAPLAEPRDVALPVLADHRPPARPVARHEPHRHAGPPVRPCGRAGDRDAPAGHGAARLPAGRPGARHVARAARSCCRCRPATRWRRRRPSSPCTGAPSSWAARAPAAVRWPASTR